MASSCVWSEPYSSQTALLGVKLERLDSYTQARARNAKYYQERISGLTGVQTPRASAYNTHIWNQYTLRVPDGRRDQFRDFLTARGIGSEIYYPLPLHLQECFAPATVTLPVAEQLSAECVSIPIYPELTPEQLDAVATAAVEFFAPIETAATL